MRLIFARLGENETVKFAVSELRRVIKAIDRNVEIDERVYSTYDKNIRGVIWVGTVPHEKMPKPENEMWDDNILIDIKNNEGMITGMNGRSVLFGVYRLLRELGVSWIRPADDGEVIPSYVLTPISLFVCEVPQRRYRIVCIEGEVSYDHVFSMIDWLPKAGMNGYFFQFKNPYVFFERWYSHLQNPYMEKEELNREDAIPMMKSLCEEAHRRGLLITAGGHGFITDAIGIISNGWEAMTDDSIPDDTKELVALVNGKRGIYHNTALSTQLCYSNPKVKKMVCENVVNYCLDHPEVDNLCFWLNDDINNHCECDNCKDTLPSDFYIEYLNELDRLMTEHGIKTHVMIIAYEDLCWAPEKAKLLNPSRFAMKLAPIARNYQTGYIDIDFDSLPEPPAYVRNKNKSPSNLNELFAFLRKWTDKLPNLDSTVFDYHLMWNHRADYSYMNCAKLLFSDMQNLDKVGLNGMISCQIGRCAFPTNLPMQLMADGLWSKEYDVNDRMKSYFKSAFGDMYEGVLDYFETLSKSIDARTWAKGMSDEAKKNALHGCDVAEQKIYEFRPIINEQLDLLKSGPIYDSYRYLSLHSELMLILLPTLRAVVKEDPAKAELAKVCSEWVQRRESDLHKVFDVCQFVNRMDNIIVGNL